MTVWHLALWKGMVLSLTKQGSQVYQETSVNVGEVTCHKCGAKGHFASACPSPNRSGSVNLVVGVDDDTSDAEVHAICHSIDSVENGYKSMPEEQDDYSNDNHKDHFTFAQSTAIMLSI